MDPAASNLWSKLRWCEGGCSKLEKDPNAEESNDRRETEGKQDSAAEAQRLSRNGAERPGYLIFILILIL